MIKKLSLIILSILLAVVAGTSVVLGLTACDIWGEAEQPDTTQSESFGGTTSDGNTSGGNTSDGNTSDGNTSDGNTSDGNTSGGNTSGGNTSGGSTSGGNTSGGNTSGGNTSGGNTSGGNTSGGNTSGGNTSGSGDNQPHTCSFKLIRKIEAGCLTEGYDLYACSCGKQEKRNKVKACGHDYKQTVYKATCIKEWYMTEECTRCKDFKTTTVEGTTGPHDIDWKVTKAATCVAEGIEQGQCKLCGKKESRTVPVTEHSYGEYVSDNNVTCGKDGTKTATCSGCGKKDTVKDVDATGDHVFGEYTLNDDATCTEDGTKSAICNVCGKEDKQPAPDSKAHKYEWTETIICQEIHSTGVCKYCGDIKESEYTGIVYDDFSSHDFKWTTVLNATCTEDGYRDGTCLRCGFGHREILKARHDPDGNNICKVCGEAIGVCSKKIYIEFCNDPGTTPIDYFGTVYFDVVVINPVNRKKDNGICVMKYDIYVVQSYEIDGQVKTTREKVVLDRPDEIGNFFQAKLLRTTDKSVITFDCVADYSVDDTSKHIGLGVSGKGSLNLIDYSFTGHGDWNYD